MVKRCKKNLKSLILYYGMWWREYKLRDPFLELYCLNYEILDFDFNDQNQTDDSLPEGDI